MAVQIRVYRAARSETIIPAEGRRRPDRSPTRNGYRLALNPPPGKMSPALARCHPLAPGHHLLTLVSP